MKTMKNLKQLAAAAFLAALLAAPFSTQANEKKTGKAKPYPLKTCVVTDEKLGGEMGDPYVFTHEGQEMKLCCKSCLKTFNKDSKKYLKKVETAAKPDKKS